MTLTTLKARCFSSLALCLFLLIGKNGAQTLSFSVNPMNQCFNASANSVTAAITSTVPGATSYSWAVSSASCNPTVNILFVNGSVIQLLFPCASTHTITAYAINGSSTLTAVSQTFQMVAAPSASVNVTPFSASGCPGTTFTLSNSGAATYTCYGPGANGLTGTNMVITPSVTGCYTVIGTSSVGCTSSQVVCLTINPLPSVSASGPSFLCTGGSALFTASGAISYTWYPGAITGSSIFVSPLVSTCYTLIGANSNGCTMSAVSCVSVMPLPSITISSPAGSFCPGGSATLSASGAITYSWSNSTTSSSIVVTPSVSTCYTVAGTNTWGCIGSAVSCLTLFTNPNISVLATSVCIGSSTTFTAMGAATYTWNTSPPVSGPTLNIIPTSASSVYTVNGTAGNGCSGSATVAANVLTTCADVWPGDANRDGIVSTADVLELGLWASSSGPARTTTSNAWVSQHASAWTGTISTGWNRVHADCNGDGTINAADTVAISANFSLTHSFKAPPASANPDIKLVPQYSVAYAGIWNKADILLGDAAAPLTQLYGVAFDLNYDQAMIQTDSVKIVYTASFLNASNQNIVFRKTNFSGGKLYAATVRTNHNNVNGNGKIGELWYKVKTGLPQNASINLSSSNAISTSNAASMATLVSASPVNLNVNNNPLGLNNLSGLENPVRMYPNPAKDLVWLVNNGNGLINFHLTDLTGRMVFSGRFDRSVKLDVSSYQEGIYFIELESESGRALSKLMITK